MPFWFEVVLTASGASDQDVWGAFVPFHGCSNDNFGGRGRLRQPAVENFISGQYISCVIDTGDNIFPRCRWKRSQITKMPKFIADTTENLFTGVNNTADKFVEGVGDTGD